VEYRRQLFLQQHLKGLSTQEIANATGLSLKTVSRDLREAKKKNLEKENEGIRNRQFEELETQKLFIWEKFDKDAKFTDVAIKQSLRRLISAYVRNEKGKLTELKIIELIEEIVEDIREFIPKLDVNAIEKLTRAYTRICERQARLMNLDIQPEYHFHHEVAKNVVIESVDYRKDLHLVAPVIDAEAESAEDETEIIQ
jgi:predicted transcriptional regulator